jgi:hypothetical protein
LLIYLYLTKPGQYQDRIAGPCRLLTRKPFDQPNSRRQPLDRGIRRPSTRSSKSGARESSRTRSPSAFPSSRGRGTTAGQPRHPHHGSLALHPHWRRRSVTPYHSRPISRLVTVAGQHRLPDHYRSPFQRRSKPRMGASRRRPPNLAHSPSPPSPRLPRRLHTRWPSFGLMKRTWRRGAIVSRQHGAAVQVSLPRLRAASKDAAALLSLARGRRTRLLHAGCCEGAPAPAATTSPRACRRWPHSNRGARPHHLAASSARALLRLPSSSPCVLAHPRSNAIGCRRECAIEADKQVLALEKMSDIEDRSFDQPLECLSKGSRQRPVQS